MFVYCVVFDFGFEFFTLHFFEVLVHDEVRGDQEELGGGAQASLLPWQVSTLYLVSKW